MAYSAAIKDQWIVHILYWFVCWISKWIFRCIYNGLIKACFELKNATITESSVLLGSKIQCGENVDINWRFSIILPFNHEIITFMGVGLVFFLSFLQLILSWTSSGVAPHTTFFLFCKWNILFEIQTALIIETDIALDFESLSAVDIGKRKRNCETFLHSALVWWRHHLEVTLMCLKSYWSGRTQRQVIWWIDD